MTLEYDEDLERRGLTEPGVKAKSDDVDLVAECPHQDRGGVAEPSTAEELRDLIDL